MSQSVTEFIYFKVKPSVKPEDPNNREGEDLLNVFRATKHQSGHSSSAWGRTIEDQDTIVWVIEWTDPRSSTTVAHLQPFLATTQQPPTALYATLQPAISGTETLTKNPVTELCALPFPSNLSAPEIKALNADLINFRTALIEELPQAEGPQSWTMGHVDRPGTVQHRKSPTTQAMIYLLAVGWESVEVHKKAKETEQFAKGIAPIREKMLPPVPGLEMKHVSFQKI